MALIERQVSSSGGCLLRGFLSAPLFPRNAGCNDQRPSRAVPGCAEIRWNVSWCLTPSVVAENIRRGGATPAHACHSPGVSLRTLPTSLFLAFPLPLSGQFSGFNLLLGNLFRMHTGDEADNMTLVSNAPQPYFGSHFKRFSPDSGRVYQVSQGVHAISNSFFNDFTWPKVVRTRVSVGSWSQS